MQSICVGAEIRSNKTITGLKLCSTQSGKQVTEVGKVDG